MLKPSSPDDNEDKRAEGLATFDTRTVAINILGPMTMATTTRAKHVLVMTDLLVAN